LEDVARTVINSCVAGPASPGNNGALLPVFNAANVGLTGGIRYSGGGSGGGQSAIQAGQQRIAPMSRPMNGTACPGGSPTTQGVLDPRGEELMIGLDGVAVVGANQTHGNSLQDPPPAGHSGGCDDAIAGTLVGSGLPVSVTPAAGCLATDGCVGGTYTFNDWKDVLAMLYGGQNHTSAPQLLARCSVTTTTVCAVAADCPAGETCTNTSTGKPRNINRINCASPVRQALAANWGTLFETNCGKDPVNAQACIKLKHAFRRGDLSGTTDTFVTLVGMVAVPGASALAVNNFEAIQLSTATANAFCNAGTRVMNKGHSDYLDLDPIRRISDSGAAAQSRVGFEQVAEPGQAPSNPPNPLIPDLRADPAAVLTEINEFGAPSNRQNWGPDPTNIAAPNPAGGLLNPAFAAAQGPALLARKGLGLVLPVEIPTNLTDESMAYWSAAGQAFGSSPVICNGFAPSLPDSAPHGICPDGKSGQACLLPVRVDGGIVSTYNCMTANALPARPGTSDERVFNLMLVDINGHFVLDGYTNPNLTLAAIRQNRVVTAYFRLNVSQANPVNGVPTLAGVPTPAFGVVAPAANSFCKALTSTDQIGCLVKASPCSIGFAGREAADKLPSALNSFAYQLGIAAADALPPTDTNINTLLDPSPTANFYKMSRKLFVNHWVDPAFTTIATDPNFANEEILYNCFKDPLVTNPAVGTFHFLPLATGPVVNNVCPNNR
jgi:hypothetical protein